MKVYFKREGTTLGAMTVIVILVISAGWIVTGCQAAPTPTPIPTATATPMPTATATPMPTATATPNVAATQTAQAQASITAQAAVTATLQAQVGATMAAQRAGTATVQAQQAAAAAATAQFVNVFADTLTKNAKKVFGPAEGMIDESSVPGVKPPWTFNSAVSANDFITEARFFNPPDAGNRAWDYGFAFRWPFPPPQGSSGTCPVQYVVRVGSDKNYFANFALGKPLPSSGCEQKNLLRGTLSNLDVSPTGSNLLRLVVNNKTAIFYVNGQYQTTFDTSDFIEVGSVFVRAGFAIPTPLPVRFTDFTVWMIQ